jgi:catechol-2,3-dioxygenase
VEVTCARPREEWRWQGDQPAVVADPMKLEDFTNEPGADEPFTGLPAGTEMGHVQLKVTDAELKATEPFYTDLLGFEVQGRLGIQPRRQPVLMPIPTIDDDRSGPLDRATGERTLVGTSG